MPEVAPDMRTDTARPPVPSYADVVEFGRDAIDAALNVASALSVWLEAIGLEVGRYVRAAESTGESVLGARSFEDVAPLRTEFAKRSFADFLERSATLSELGCSLIGASVGAWAPRAKS